MIMHPVLAKALSDVQSIRERAEAARIALITDHAAGGAAELAALDVEINLLAAARGSNDPDVQRLNALKGQLNDEIAFLAELTRRANNAPAWPQFAWVLIGRVFDVNGKPAAGNVAVVDNSVPLPATRTDRAVTPPHETAASTTAERDEAVSSNPEALILHRTGLVSANLDTNGEFIIVVPNDQFPAGTDLRLQVVQAVGSAFRDLRTLTPRDGVENFEIHIPQA